MRQNGLVGKKMAETYGLENYSFKKSNEMISAKYKSTLLENQIMAIALTRIERNSKDSSAPLEARLYPGELSKLVSDQAHIYRDLKKVAKTITGHSVIMEDGKGNFRFKSIRRHNQIVSIINMKQPDFRHYKKLAILHRIVFTPKCRHYY